jgi:hypothetical protein
VPLLGRHRHADEIAGGLEFLDQAIKPILAHIPARNAHPVHPARAPRMGTVDDHGVVRIKETGDIRYVCLRRKPHQGEGTELKPARTGGRIDAVSKDERASTRSCSTNLAMTPACNIIMMTAAPAVIMRGWAAIGRASNFRTSREACTGALMSAGVKSVRLPSRSRGAVFWGRGSRRGSISVKGCASSPQCIQGNNSRAS